MVLIHRAPRRSALAAFAAFVVMAAACGSDTPTSPDAPQAPTTPIGSYGLSTVNGKPVPVTIFTDTAFTEVIAAASLALTADGKYVFAKTTNETVAGYLSVYVDSVSGSWARQGTSSAITFTSSEASVPAVTGTWVGNSISLLDPDAMAWVFTRK